MVNTRASKPLAASAWAAFRAHRSLLAFPLLSAALVIATLTTLGTPAVIAYLADQTAVGIAFTVAALLTSQILATIVSGGLIAAADAALRGEPAGLGRGMARALRRVGPLIVVALVQVGVGALIGAIRGNSDSGAAAIGRSVAAGAASVAWSVLTLFVLPLIVLAGEGPVAAIRHSGSLIRERWGTQVVGAARITGGLLLRFFLPGLLALLAGGGVLVLGGSQSIAPLVIGAVCGAVGVLFIIAGAMTGAVLSSLFRVALYRYATDEQLSGPFTAEDLAGALRTRS
ncbi:MAG: hypothetical protein KGP10_02630 [Actinomycetales bacterium]|nr:hypothetical protein [Actinomycetales bacterium]